MIFHILRTYPFQNNHYNLSHPFVKTVNFEQVIKLYVFDRQLSHLVFDG
ncbi:MAG: Abi family protein [Bacteroidia bacterium]|nr:Abi family protein [Bacteroidia bacterium]